MFLIFLLSGVWGQYCVSGPQSSEDTNLGPVSLQGEGNTNIADPSNCPKTVGPKNLTGLSANLTVGKSYSLSFQVTACGSFYPYTVGAWIDYNNNGVFDASENLFFVNNMSSANYTQLFVVPLDITYFGSTRLRLQLQETNSSTINACANFTYGATKDFTVVLGRNDQYCTCGPTNIEDTHLGPTILQGDKIDIIEYYNPCPGSIGPVNYTDQRADLAAGSTYQIALTVITCNKQFPNILTSGWIDFNHNGEFEESEVIVPLTSRFGAIFATFTVPHLAKEGSTGMRLQVQEILNGATSIAPCDMFKYGGTKDYPITILAPRDNGMNYRE